MFVSSKNLRIGDVELLLEEYKVLSSITCSNHSCLTHHTIWIQRLVIENERLKLVLTTNNIDPASALNEGSTSPTEEQDSTQPGRRKRTPSAHRRTQSSV